MALALDATRIADSSGASSEARPTETFDRLEQAASRLMRTSAHRPAFGPSFTDLQKANQEKINP